MKYLLVLIFICSLNVRAKPPLTSSRLNKLSGDSKVNFDHKTVWDRRYNKRVYIYGKAPAVFLAENFDFISAESKVLDVGMGEGRNAVFLAQKGHHVTGIDISSVAVKKAKLLAKERNVRISTIIGTVNKYNFKPNSFDVILCFYFVDRSLNKKLISWLKPGGLLIYAAYSLREYDKPQTKKENINYYLKSQELLTMFPGMTILKYEEPLHEKFYRAGIILKKKE